ncbi:MAG: calmodulin [Paraglaciecola sp.]|jgi:calmodulin
MSEQGALAAEKVAEIRKEFDYFDSDGNGTIGLTEFIELLTILSPKTKASHVQEGFSLIDKNNNGSIDFPEFLEWWQSSWWEY